MTCRFSFDIGIGSVGWAVIRTDDGKRRIENFGTRVFASGESAQQKNSACQDRRGFRSVRRIERRRSYRKQLLRAHLQNIGMINPEFEDELLDCKDLDVYALKVRGLDEQLTPAELYKCLVHTCNHRGYRNFYDISAEDEEEADKEEGVNRQAASEFERRFSVSGKRIVSEYLLSECREKNFVNYRNRKDSLNEYLLVSRNLLEEECRRILEKQSAFYPALTRNNISETLRIIFNQRAFEDGPGDANDAGRRYQGFLSAIGHCPFHKDELRGFRNTVIADVFAVINTLSQYHYIDKETGEFYLKPEAASEMTAFLLDHAGIGMKDVKAIAEKHNLTVSKSDRLDEKNPLSKSVHFLKSAKTLLEAAGENWNAWISEEQFETETPSRLHLLSDCLSRYQTPKRRKEALEKLGFLNSDCIRAFLRLKSSGTANAGYRYMCEAIHAFMRGDIYGNFQAEYQQTQADSDIGFEKYEKLPQITDEDIRDNPIVFKAVNETRKVLNALIAVYGSPEDIVIEVADELGKSFEDRDKADKANKKREKETDQIKADIAKILGYESADINKVTPKMIERYKLFHQQEEKDPYSGRPLGALADILHDPTKIYEVDHIIPYSLILDDTLHNKVLTFAAENQAKKQRTPLMYLEGERKTKYLEFVAHMYARDNGEKGKAKKGTGYPPVSAKKYGYLTLDRDLRSPDVQELLSEWKSRNINDTRYITKYISGLISKNLKFTENDGKHVWGIKGAVTSRFRRIWFADTVWGDENKNRDSYLNHALDAVVIGNLTLPYIEIASDAVKLRSLYFKHRKNTSAAEYQEYLTKCVEKMEKYYFFAPSYTKRLLQEPEKIPTFVPDLKEEVLIRFNDTDPEKFAAEIKEKYGDCSDFILAPQMPITSHKPERKFKGCIADSNPVRIEVIDGETYKISRKPIREVLSKDIPNLFGADPALLSTLTRIFDGKGEKYTVEDYMKELDIRLFLTDAGQPVRKVSVISGKYSNYYRKNISDTNYTYLGMPKYYCVEVYQDKDGKTQIRGIKFVDVIKDQKKLFIKSNTLPSDYDKHILYLFSNDYIILKDKKGKIKFEGYYKAVFNINQSKCYYALPNTPVLSKKAFTISQNDTVSKIDISILGRKGGEIRCSEPLSLIPVNESGSKTTG